MIPAPQLPPLPSLPEWLRWLGDLPAPFRQTPLGFPGGRVRTGAVVADLFESLFGAPPDPAFLAAFEPSAATGSERNRLALVLAACHLLWHPALRALPLSAPGLSKLLVEELASLAPAFPAAGLDQDEERREELVRRALRAAGHRLPGESEAEAEDRLKQVDSIERRRVLAAAAEREKRSREVREAMAKKAAEEAAAKVSRE